jgi:hypothetical protein
MGRGDMHLVTIGMGPPSKSFRAHPGLFRHCSREILWAHPRLTCHHVFGVAEDSIHRSHVPSRIRSFLS